MRPAPALLLVGLGVTLGVAFGAALLVACGPGRSAGARDPAVAAGDREAWRATPPPRRGPPRFVPPPTHELRLASGVRVIVVENHALPLVTVRIVAPLGAADVPAGRQGLASVLVHMLATGGGARDAVGFGHELASLGAALDVEAGDDGCFVTVEILGEHLDATLDLVADVLRRPRLDGATFARVREAAIADARAELARGRGAGLAAVRHAFLGDAPAAAGPPGDEAGLRALALDDVLAFHRAAFDPRTLTLVVVGDVTPADLAPRLEARLGDWPPPPGPPASPAPAPATGAATRVLLLDRPDAPQVDLVIGAPGLPRTSPDWPALAVMNHAFGGIYASRVNLLLREEKGYTYAFRSFPESSRRLDQVSMRTAVRPEVALAALDAITGEVRRFVAAPPTGDELERARRVLLTEVAMRFMSNREAAAAFDDLVLRGLPLDDWARFADAVAATSAEDVARLARQVLVEGRLVVVLVGPVAALAEPLAARGVTVERIGDPAAASPDRR